MGLSGVYNDAIPEEDGIAILKEAYGKGVTFWDTSDIYGVDHANEYLVGKVILRSDQTLKGFFHNFTFDVQLKWLWVVR